MDIALRNLSLPNPHEDAKVGQLVCFAHPTGFVEGCSVCLNLSLYPSAKEDDARLLQRERPEGCGVAEGTDSA